MMAITLAQTDVMGLANLKQNTLVIQLKVFEVFVQEFVETDSEY